MTSLAIIGYPIGHSLSPVIYNAAFPAMGIDAHYDAWATPADELPAAIRRLRGPEMLGLSVTVPHKQAVMPLVDEVDETARAIGAVNCISKGEDGRLVGHNTDAYGFLRSLREAGFEPGGTKVLVLGVGGSARAVGYSLAQAGAASIALAGRTQAHVAALATHLRGTTPAAVGELGWQDEAFEAACRNADLIVNCTPIGMLHTAEEGVSPVDAALLRHDIWVCDLVYNPSQTVLLRLAGAAGAHCVGGLEMLVYQAVQSVQLWTGKDGPVDIMRAAARRALGFEA